MILIGDFLTVSLVLSIKDKMLQSKMYNILLHLVIETFVIKYT